MLLESDIQTKIIEYLHGRPFTYVYNAGGGASSARGTSDLLVCYRGLFVAFELKRPDGNYGLTTPQRIRFRQVHKAQGVAEVVTSIDDVRRVLDLITKKGEECNTY